MFRSWGVKSLTAVIATLAMTAIAVSSAEADPWHGGGWHPGPRGPVVVVRPGYYYGPPPPVYYYPPPPVVYAAPPPAVVYQPTPVVVAPPPPPPIVCHQSDTGAALGAAAGGTAGAIIGATTTHGRGQFGATAGGAILGLLLGGVVGHAADAADQDCAATAVAYGPVGQPVGWAGPQGTQYQVTPVNQYQANGTTCREYVANAAVDGRWQQVRGTACAQPDGSWRVVTPPPPQ